MNDKDLSISVSLTHVDGELYIYKHLNSNTYLAIFVIITFRVAFI